MHANPSQIQAYIAGGLDPKARRGVERHVHRCLACWEHLQAATPRTAPQWVQNQDYTQGQFSAQVPLRAQTLLSASVPHTAYAEPSDQSRFRPWIPAVAVLGILAILGTLVGLAWTLGGPSSAATAQKDPTGSWSAEATGLDADDLEELRSAGWSCPVIEIGGFQLASATGTRSKGSAEVHIVLKHDDKEVRVTEVRALAGNTLATGVLAAPAAPAAPAAKTQGSEVTDGALADLGRRLGAKAGATVDVGKGTATLSMDGVNYSIASNLSKKDTEALLQRLVIGEHTHFSGFDSDPDQLGERFMRGLSRLMVLDFS